MQDTFYIHAPLAFESVASSPELQNLAKIRTSQSNRHLTFYRNDPRISRISLALIRVSPAGEIYVDMLH